MEQVLCWELAVGYASLGTEEGHQTSRCDRALVAHSSSLEAVGERCWKHPLEVARASEGLDERTCQPLVMVVEH